MNSYYIDDITGLPALIPVKYDNKYVCDLMTLYTISIFTDHQITNYELLNVDAYATNISNDRSLQARIDEVEKTIEMHYPVHNFRSFTAKYEIFCNVTTQQYLSARNHILQKHKSMEMFYTCVQMVFLVCVLTYAEIITIPLCIIINSFILNQIIISLIDWVWPAERYSPHIEHMQHTYISNISEESPNPFQTQRTSHVIIENRDGISMNLNSLTIRQVLREILITSPFGDQGFAPSKDGGKPHISVKKIINLVPPLFKLIEYLVRGCLLFSDYLFTKPKPDPHRPSQYMVKSYQLAQPMKSHSKSAVPDSTKDQPCHQDPPPQLHGSPSSILDQSL